MTAVLELHQSDIANPGAPGVSVLRIALAGRGAVGSALVREIAASRDALVERHGVEIEFVRVLVRDVGLRRDVALDPSLLTNDVDAFLETEADVVVEAIGGLDPARRIAETVLARGQRLVTANKLLLAAHGSGLADLARRNGTTIRYDAAVGGGVPILRLLDDALGAGGASRVRGILNGTTNFVLSRIEEGCRLDEALAAAQLAGFAEADASRDLDGRDAQDKIKLIAWAAFGVAPESLAVRVVSLLPEPARYVALGERLGLRVRQVAECLATQDGVVASVAPLFVNPSSALARTRDEGNHADVFAGWRAPLCASGPGAGGLPTATALLSDLVTTGVGPRRRGGARAGSEDPRQSRWVVEIRGAAATLHRTIPRCRHVFTDDRATSAWTILESTTAAEIDELVTTLEATGVHPIAVRLEEDCCCTHEVAA
ncbi:MAG: homoserine dehydrogenase [Gemmatimonadota bacterium]